MELKKFIKNKAPILIEGIFIAFLFRAGYFLLKVAQSSWEAGNYFLTGAIVLVLLYVVFWAYFSIQKLKIFFDQSLPAQKRKRAFFKVFVLFLLSFFVVFFLVFFSFSALLSTVSF